MAVLKLRLHLHSKVAPPSHLSCSSHSSSSSSCLLPRLAALHFRAHCTNEQKLTSGKGQAQTDRQMDRQTAVADSRQQAGRSSGRQTNCLITAAAPPPSAPPPPLAVVAAACHVTPCALSGASNCCCSCCCTQIPLLAV